MYDAAERGDVALVKSLLEQGVDANEYKDWVRRIHIIIYTIKILFEIR